LHFGNSKKGDLTLCDVHGSKYFIKDEHYDLNASSVSLKLVSSREHVPPLSLNLSVKTNGMIRMTWSYQDPNRTRPFEVPNDIVDLSQFNDSKTLKIGDFIKLDNHSKVHSD